MSSDKKPRQDLTLLELAKDRNRLANERTMLAYMRTSIMLLATGGTLIKLFAESAPAVIGGALLVGTGMFVATVALWRFVRLRMKLR